MNHAESPTSKRNPTLRRTTATLDSHAAASSSSRRQSRRSRSPRPNLQTRIAQARADEPSQSASVKKRRSGTATMGQPLGSTPHPPSIQTAAEDERGRKSKIPKSKGTARLAADNAQASTSRVEHRHSARERSRSRESARESQAPTDIGEESSVEIVKLRRELEKLQKKEHEHKKSIKKQKQHLEEIRQQLAAKEESVRESKEELQGFQAKARKAEEALSTIEVHSQCHICMDLLHRPYTLPGCGHTLCMSCLQEWFRQAPPADGETYDEEDPQYLMYRTKHCPACRTKVSHRPVPCFVMNSIVATLEKAKAAAAHTTTGSSPAPPRSPSPPADADPWKGLFPPDGEHEPDGWDGDESPAEFEGPSDSDDDDDEDEDDDSDDMWYDDNFSYGSDSDAPPYDGLYTEPAWEPAQFDAATVATEHYPLEDLLEDDLRVLARGGRIGMMHAWELRYAHEEGLSAFDERGNRYFLGWNVRLSADDEDGNGYMEWVMADMQIHPERWRIEHLEDGTYDAHRLVPCDSVEEYSDTDSDDY
ncbi:hypothetical protein CONPUDRAFT_91356 [Coniophora puteana RWD-64-598 SS2]|uniref:RING-type domain-containing protein n=1 Tax=Coniophora puteana (strain RWD-64-598) TaxID=741705 RepID=A0A5M3MIF0_CONPW|nr:uncharacterized protein CONPUDRAFT_91356 [Coniophora puteana RWD-64-598 SS2]EIW79018.1 hypothetical protein CONPUDRAFT_91356 [Coniophora puteana RWD-64-598 SS2]